MSELRCKISLRQDMTRYLGTWNADHENTWMLAVVAADDPHGINWILKDIPGSRAKFLIKDGGRGSGAYVTWVGGVDGIMLLRPHQDGWDEQVVLLDDVNGGFVAINNHDRDRVMDLSGTSPPFVISFRWNGGDNQQWFIREQAALP